MLEASYEAARRITRTHAKSFYFASHALPSGKRCHAYAVYAFCRHVDDEVDEAGDITEVGRRLDGLRILLHKIFSGRACGGAPQWLDAFRHTTVECDIPELYFLDLLHGVEMDRGRVRLQNWEELNRYCYYVAGVVGLMMTRIFGLQDRRFEKQAVELGVAMQLTNILRDVREDYARDRIYLPAEELTRFGLAEEDVAAGRVSPAWVEFVKFQIARARGYYESSETGLQALPDDGCRRTAWMMREIYAGILDEIERGGCDVFSKRHSVSLAGKCALALRAWRKAR